MRHTIHLENLSVLGKLPLSLTISIYKLAVCDMKSAHNSIVSTMMIHQLNGRDQRV